MSWPPGSRVEAAGAGIHRLADIQPHPTLWLVVVAGLVALGAVADRRVWPVARNVVTIVHEAGHALVAVLTGRRLRGIRLHADTSGLTVSVGRPTGPGMAATTAAGYVAPSLVGLGAAALLAAGRVTLLLWAAVALLALMIPLLRNAYGIVAVLATGAAVVAVSLLAPPTAQAAFGYAGDWFLLLGGVRAVTELGRERRWGRAPHSDADHLGALTRLPGAFWVVVFGLVDLGALALGGAWLAGSGTT